MKVVLFVEMVLILDINLIDQVDISFATGLLAFDEVCKRFETMAVRQEDELKTALARLQVCLS